MHPSNPVGAFGKWRTARAGTICRSNAHHPLPPGEARDLTLTGFVRYLAGPCLIFRRPDGERWRRCARRSAGSEVPDGAGAASQSLGIPEIDGALPGGGLRMGCVHEIGGDEAATGFCATLLARASGEQGPIIWLARKDDLYLPGLVRYGIEPGRLLLVSGLRRQTDVLWAMEEVLRCHVLRGVVAELDTVDRATSRRLMLAAEGSGVMGLVLGSEAGRRWTGRARVPTLQAVGG